MTVTENARFGISEQFCSNINIWQKWVYLKLSDFTAAYLIKNFVLQFSSLCIIPYGI